MVDGVSTAGVAGLIADKRVTPKKDNVPMPTNKGMRYSKERGHNKGPISKVTKGILQTFLNQLSEGSSVAGACRVIGVDVNVLYKLRKKSTEFAALWAASIECGTDLLEDEALRRAKDGWLEPIFQGGTEVGQVRRYSNVLLIFLLKGRRPKKFRDKIEIDASDDLKKAFAMSMESRGTLIEGEVVKD